MSLPCDLEELLDESDVMGAIGNARFGGKYHLKPNVLLKDVTTSNTEGQLKLHGYMCQPEGGSKGMYAREIFSSASDTQIAQNPLVIAWNHPEASRFLTSRFQCKIQHVAIDSDWTAVQNYAMTHGSTIIDADPILPWDTLKNCDTDVIIHGNMTHRTWLTAVATWTVDVLTLSSPCPPWSNAGAGAGLQSAAGLLFPTGILLARFLRPRIILVEQVNGFSTHADKQFCIRCFMHIGYRLKWFRVVEAASFGAAKRARWLGVAIHVHDADLSPLTFDMWPSVSPLTPGSLGALFTAEQIDMSKLRITEEMKTLISDPRFLPFFDRQAKRHVRPQDLWKERATSKDQQAQTFMSKYGVQHLLNPSTLESKGYLGHFCLPDGGASIHDLRLFHPAEIIMMHLCFDQWFMPATMTDAWAHVGNFICVPHALLLMTNGIKCIPGFEHLDVERVFQRLLDDHMTSVHLVQVTHDVGTFFVDPRFVTMNQQEAFGQRMTHLQELQTYTADTDRLGEYVWVPDQGITTLQLWKDRHNAQVPSSMVTDEEAEDTPMDATIPFESLLKVRMLVDDVCAFFWLSPTCSVANLIHCFDMPMQVADTPHDSAGCSFTVRTFQPDVHHGSMAVRADLLPVVNEGLLTLHALQPDEPLTALALRLMQESGLSVIYDQYGKVEDGMTCKDTAVLMPSPLTHGALNTMPFFLLAAAQQTRCSAVWDSQAAALCFRFYGDQVPVEVMKHFWVTRFPQQVLDTLQVSWIETTHQDHVSLTLKFRPGSFVLPPIALIKCLQVTALRGIMDAMHVPTGIPLTLKWLNHELWSGACESLVSGEVLIQLLDIAYAPFRGDGETRLVHQGKQVCGITLAELMRLSSLDRVVIHVGHGLRGGTGQKDSVRTYIKNSLAATLLEQGYPLQWTSSAVDDLMQKAGMKHLQSLAAMTSGQARLDKILQTCKDCSLTVPDRIAMDAQRTATRGSQAVRDRKKTVVQPNPDHYQIQVSYLKNADGSNPQQLQDFTATASGVSLMDAGTALPWIRENRVISRDELAIAVIGHHVFETTLKTQQCTLPCLDRQGNPVILAVTLCQFGEKELAPITSDKHVAVQPCVTIAMTLWREDWNDSDWQQALEHSIPFVRKILANNNLDSAVEALWGRSIRGSAKSSTTNLHAQSIQLHAAVQQAKVSEVLRHSGFNRLFAVPKNDEGRIDHRWKVVWLEGSLAHLTSLASQTSHCEGLVRNRNSWGLRFAQEHFQQAWKTLQGDKPLPLDIQVKHTFRIEPLPFGATSEMLVEWSKLLPWEFKPIKAVGPRAWVVGSQAPPPPGVHTFNSNPVLIKQIQPKGAAVVNPVLAGPKPTRDPKHAMITKDDPFQDPWAPYLQQRGIAASSQAAPRATQGPIDKRFAEHEAKFAQMEKTIESLQSSTQQGFAEVAQREKQMQSAIVQVKTDLERSFQSVIAQQSNQLNNNIDDLKALILARCKRDREPGDDDMTGTG
eukprot:Skav233648  [mRNA]  locus=scaffold2779:730007:734620:- [translate_table: standard]